MQSSVELERETGAATDSDGSEERDDAEESGARLAGLRRRLARIFSPRAFLLASLFVVVGLVAGGLVGGLLPLLGTVGRLVGVFAGTFLFGVVRSRRQYLEVALAGAIVAVLVVVSSSLDGAFLPVGVSLLQEYGIAIAGVGAGSGAATSLLGYYFGRDLRAGLTESL
ncbi:MAG: hypothetical protein V5A38_12000 [Halolamina sp.]|uniref:hypothetical protein n=1 Tax=Halolamina sp. TaxID=1940283 RepID=UPI002FC38170